jgi:hypothetical protein
MITEGRVELPAFSQQKKEKTMIARFDHRPMLTALLALTTTLLFVVVVTLSTLLITLSPEATSSTSDGGNAPAPAMGGAVGSNFSYDTAVDRHAEMVAAKTGHYFFQGSYSERQAEVVAAKSGHFAP